MLLSLLRGNIQAVMPKPIARIPKKDFQIKWQVMIRFVEQLVEHSQLEAQ